MPLPPLQLVGAAASGQPVSFSVTGALPNSSVRIVVISGGLALRSGPAPLTTSLGCYTGTPTAVGTADATTDGSGNVGPTVVWPSATAGQYTAYLLQGTCASTVRAGGRTMEAVSDQQIVAQDGFTVGDPVPALSPLGLAAMGVALAVAGGAFLSRSRP
jgi:hypothetical protein